MSSPDEEDIRLPISKAAKLAGVCADTLRDWDRQGRIKAERTPGGQRRFRKADVLAAVAKVASRAEDEPRIVRTERSERAAGRPIASPSLPPSRAPRIFADDVGAFEVVEAASDLERLRLAGERERLQRALEREAAEAAKVARAEEDSRRQLDALEELKARGRALAADLPIHWRQAVTSDLEAYVTSLHLPSSLNREEKWAFVEARVREVRRRHDAELARQRKIGQEQVGQAIERIVRAREQAKIDGLIQHGQAIARIRAIGWDRQDAEEFLADVMRHLNRDVGSDWSTADVLGVVDEVLLSWDGDEDDEIGEDYDDRDDEF